VDGGGDTSASGQQSRPGAVVVLPNGHAHRAAVRCSVKFDAR